ncbi:MAG: hypothetical protein OXN21_14180 [Chloroflexota bacterium]|nr:hypothetical protein [Chloroflexota bacterium]
MAKKELLSTIRDRYLQSSRKDKGLILDEFTAVTGLHRKHAIRLLAQARTAMNRFSQWGGAWSGLSPGYAPL